MPDPFFDQPGRDGRRKSNPLKDVDSAPAAAPDWQLYRKISALDPDTILTVEKAGLNCGHYDSVRIQAAIFTDATLDTPVIPGPGKTGPDLEILAWNPQMKRFLPITDGQTTSALEYNTIGAGASYTTNPIDVKGSRILVRLKSAPQNGEVVAIYAQGFGLNHTL